MSASLDRFSAACDEPPVVSECEQCGAEIYEDTEYCRYEDVDFCDKYCAVNWLLDEGIIEVVP